MRKYITLLFAILVGLAAGITVISFSLVHNKDHRKKTGISNEANTDTGWVSVDDLHTYWYFRVDKQQYVVLGTDCWYDERVLDGKTEKRSSSAPRLFMCYVGGPYREGLRIAEELELPLPGWAKRGDKYVSVESIHFEPKTGLLSFALKKVDKDKKHAEMVFMDWKTRAVAGEPNCSVSNELLPKQLVKTKAPTAAVTPHYIAIPGRGRWWYD